MIKLQPHFLFNAFNNIYSLIRKDPDKGAEALLQLSSVLEYIVYLKPAEKVPIRSELEVIHQYVGFTRIHKSYIVNNQKVTAAGMEELLVGKTALPVGITFREEVKRTAHLPKSNKSFNKLQNDYIFKKNVTKNPPKSFRFVRKALT